MHMFRDLQRIRICYSDFYRPERSRNLSIFWPNAEIKAECHYIPIKKTNSWQDGSRKEGEEKSENTNKWNYKWKVKGE